MDEIKSECVEIVPELHEVHDLTSVAVNTVSSPQQERNEREMVIRFIEMVKQCPGIWDVSSEAYRNKLIRRRSFRRIGEELGWSFDDVVKKYNNLRTYYSKEIIKEKKSVGYKSKWPYFNQLDTFMRQTVHMRMKPGMRARMTLLEKRANDRLAGYDVMVGGTTLRRKRLLVNPSDVRHRQSFHPRSVNTVSATATAPDPTFLSLSSSAPPISPSASGPQANISHLPSALVPQQHNQPTSSTQSQSQRQHVTPQQQQQQRQHGAQQQPPQSRAKQQLAVPTVTKNANERQDSPSTLTAPSGSSLLETDSGDVIFSKLIASQMAKIKEGRKKEQLKISLMQQIVEAMFDDTSG
ncbi:uncharacterized protein [Diadema setosum]|uniref:uncharacterized protein n=1 Tax=Diadema setosum TaxID=31175 RepID=UPI003B3BD3B4